MKSVTTTKFRNCYSKLPKEIQELARKNYSIWLKNPLHPSLQFKQIHNSEPIYSARVGISYRALGIIQQGVMVWFWIGSHGDYDKLITQL